MSSANVTIIEMQKSIAELQAIVTQLGAAGAPGATDRYAAGDISWVLTSTALVFFMIPGVGYFYSGLTGRRNALSMILLSLISVAVVTFEWWLWGYSLTYSKTSNNPFIGNFDNAFLMNVWDDPSIGSPRVPDLVFCIFQGMFAAITPVLSLGSATERGRLMPMVFYIFLWSTIVYNPIAYWSWNPSGWGFTSGGLDYAGGTPVHIASGAAALAYSLILGQRRVHPEINKPHSLSHIILGTSMLWFGWLGFNGGSGLAANPRSAMACIVTNFSASMGGIVWMMLDYRLEKKLSAAGFCTGAIAGLVTITPGSGFVTPSSALVFGLVGAIACNFAIHLKKLGQYDDALDVFAVHGMGGIVGNILTGIFAQSSVAGLDGTVIPGGWLDAHWVQIGHQIADSLAGFGYAFTMTYLILFAMNKIPGLHLRATAEEEELGMDAACIGELAYWHALNDATKAAAKELARSTVMDASGKVITTPRMSPVPSPSSNFLSTVKQTSSEVVRSPSGNFGAVKQTSEPKVTSLVTSPSGNLSGLLRSVKQTSEVPRSPPGNLAPSAL